MYLSPNDIANTYHQAIDNAHGVGRLLLDTSEKIAALGFRLGRGSLEAHAGMLAGDADASAVPPGRWLVERQSQMAAASEELLHLLSASNQACIAAVQAQFRTLDRALVSAVEKGEDNAPQELGFAFGLLKRSIWRSEEALAKLGAAIATSADSIENQLDQVLGAVQAPSPARRRRKAA